MEWVSLDLYLYNLPDWPRWGPRQSTRKMLRTMVMISESLMNHCSWGPRIIYPFTHSLNSICWINKCSGHSSRHWGYSSEKNQTLSSQSKYHNLRYIAASESLGQVILPLWALVFQYIKWKDKNPLSTNLWLCLCHSSTVFLEIPLIPNCPSGWWDKQDF